MPLQQQALMWNLYASFLRLVLVGSITGMWTWSTNIGGLLFDFTSEEISLEFTSNGSCSTLPSCVAYNNALALNYAWTTANFIFYHLTLMVAMWGMHVQQRASSELNSTGLQLM